MGALLNRRRYMGGGSEEPLPQGAVRVEYLESTGTQYIVTDIYFDFSTEYELVFGFGNISSRQLFTGISGFNGDGYWAVTSSGYVENTYNIPSSVNVANGVHTFIRSAGVKTVDGTPISIASVADIAWFNRPTYPLCFFTYQNGQTNKGNGKFYQAIIRNNGAVVHNLIPVRIGQVGYMYDNVSGELFGNEGTGDFILGNDKN